MTKLNELIGAVLILFCVYFCNIQLSETREGPAEQAGKQIDKAVGDATQQIDKAGDSIRDAAKGKK